MSGIGLNNMPALTDIHQPRNINITKTNGTINIAITGNLTSAAEAALIRAIVQTAEASQYLFGQAPVGSYPYDQPGIGAYPYGNNIGDFLGTSGPAATAAAAYFNPLGVFGGSTDDSISALRVANLLSLLRPGKSGRTDGISLPLFGNSGPGHPGSV